MPERSALSGPLGLFIIEPSLSLSSLTPILYPMVFGPLAFLLELMKLWEELPVHGVAEVVTWIASMTH
jgi:hypothetical protein